jgi:hypothetical protein
VAAPAAASTASVAAPAAASVASAAFSLHAVKNKAANNAANNADVFIITPVDK